MDIFGIKRKKSAKKAEKALQEEQKKREKDIKTKIAINRALNSLKSQSAKLDLYKKSCIEKARQALLINNKQNYNLAKHGLKLCISKQNFLDSMIGNFELNMQLNEMSKVINGFFDGMQLIAEEMKGVTKIDLSKAQMAYEQAMANSQGQHEALDAFLKEAESSMEAFSGFENDVDDKEIDALISNQALDETGVGDIDCDIDKKIVEIREKMKI